MPIIDLEPAPLGSVINRPEKGFVTPGEEEATDRPSIGDILGATFRRENILASAGAAANGVPIDDDPDFAPFDHIRGTKYEANWDSFVDVRNRAQFDEATRKIDQEREDRKIIDAAPWYMSVPASLLANVTDPTILVPGGAFVKGARGGFSLARSALSVGAGAGIGTAVQEVGLQATQETRTAAESFVDIGASTLLGGLLGAGGAALFSRADWHKAVTAVERELEAAPVADIPAPGSIGAAAVSVPALSDTAVAGRVAGAVAAGSQKINPGLRLAHSEVPEARDVAGNLFEMSHYLRGNEDGLASPIAVETLRKEWNAGLMQAVADTSATYRNYRKAGGDLSRREFQEAVGRAMRRGDESPIPEVAQVAKAWRKNVFDPLKEAAINAKLLPPDVAVDTAISYFSRLWNRKRLIAEEGEFKRVVRNWISGRLDTWEAAFDAETRAGASKLEGDKLRDYLSKREAERDERFGDPTGSANDVADEVFNTLTGRTSEGVRPEFITIKARGPLKERTFNIPDELVERWLESDVDLVGRRYQRIMSADVELASKFGSPDMTEAIDKVRQGYNKLRAGVSDEKRLTALANQEKNDIRDLEAVRDIIRGTYAQSAWERDFGAIVRIANATQYILKMGQVVLSSLTEPVRVVAAQGMLPFMRDAFGAISNVGAVKMSVREARLAGNINDRILAARLSTVADLTDFYGSRGPVEKFIDNMTNVASSWNGIRLWTDGVKMLASTMIQNKILRGAADFANADKRYLAFLGIDESMAGRIAKQFAEHGEVIDGVHVAGTVKWTDEVARRAYRAALNKDIDSMVVTRGAADLPLFANTPLGRLIFQFNTFNLASHQRVLLRGLQESHARFLSGAISLTSMGMLQTYLIALATNSVNRLPDRNENPGWWIAEGLDRSGLFSVPFQISNGVEKLTGMNPIKAPIKQFDAGQALSQRNRNRNELGVLGPSAGTIHDIGTVAGIAKTKLAGEEMSKAQGNAIERLLPFNSYVGVRQFMKYFVNPPNE